LVVKAVGSREDISESGSMGGRVAAIVRVVVRIIVKRELGPYRG
jgi:hypothetical protein